MNSTALHDPRNLSLTVRVIVGLLLLLIVPLFSLQGVLVYQSYRDPQPREQIALQNQTQQTARQFDLYLSGAQWAVMITSQNPALAAYLANPMDKGLADEARTALGVLLVSLPQARSVCLASGSGTCMLTSDPSWRAIDAKQFAPPTPRDTLVRANLAAPGRPSTLITQWVVVENITSGILVLDLDTRALQPLLPPDEPGPAFALLEAGQTLLSSGNAGEADEWITASVSLNAANWQLEARQPVASSRDRLAHALQTTGFLLGAIALLITLFAAWLILGLNIPWRVSAAVASRIEQE